MLLNSCMKMHDHECMFWFQVYPYSSCVWWFVHWCPFSSGWLSRSHWVGHWHSACSHHYLSVFWNICKRTGRSWRSRSVIFLDVQTFHVCGKGKVFWQHESFSPTMLFSFYLFSSATCPIAVMGLEQCLRAASVPAALRIKFTLSCLSISNVACNAGNQFIYLAVQTLQWDGKMYQFGAGKHFCIQHKNVKFISPSLIGKKLIWVQNATCQCSWKSWFVACTLFFFILF